MTSGATVTECIWRLEQGQYHTPMIVRGPRNGYFVGVVPSSDLCCWKGQYGKGQIYLTA